MDTVVAATAPKVDGKAYLADLRKLVTRTEDDLRVRSQELDEVHTDLTSKYNLAVGTERTLETFESWRDQYLTQVAVGWILSCVFLRFLEDNALVDEVWLAGQGERLRLAHDRHQVFFQTGPTLTDRDYLLQAFATVAKLPGCHDLFGEERNPLWLLGPSGDMAKEILLFFQAVDPTSGQLLRTFASPGSKDTRFLGDLYQDLSETARKRYALLQTPDFVEEFILDRTLEPAIDLFGIDTVRMLDPTCGSGHFLLGSFARLLKRRQREKPAENERERAQRALDGVFGVDLNPFAVAIARFRLLVAALEAAGISRLKDAPNFKIHVAAGDSLLHGRRFGRGGQGLLSVDKEWLPDAFCQGDFEEATEILSQQYHAVVGNPPYIADKDRAHKEAVRQRYSSCHGKYVLAVPFKEVFFDKTVAGGRPGYMGMITANNFMKREFGVALIEEFFPSVDLTHVIDTSGAYIPGHGTPTVILFGRNQSPRSTVVRAALGIRGEPSTPSVPAEGIVWKSILALLDKPGAENEFVTVADIGRESFHKHPWSLSGGGAGDLKELVESSATKRLDEFTSSIGITSFTLEDDVYLIPSRVASRLGFGEEHQRPMVTGDVIRDWAIGECDVAVFPYDEDLLPVMDDRSLPVLKHLAPYRTVLSNNKMFGAKTKVEAGLHWYEFGRLTTDKLKTPLTITFAFVATHNHFVLDRGGKVFNRTAPVIKLPESATVDDHLALLGLLNSSVACFWLKQVCFDKGATSDRGVLQDDPEKFRFEFDGTKLKAFPVPGLPDSKKSVLLELARALDEGGRTLSETDFSAAIDNALKSGRPLRTTLDHILAEREALLKMMVRWQEELDWLCYEIYRLLPNNSPARSLVWTVDIDSMPALDQGGRPYRSKASKQDIHLEPLSTVRLEVMKSNPQVRMLESPEFKRRWFRSAGAYDASNLDDTKVLLAQIEQWLQGRVEHKLSQESQLTTTAQLSDQLRKDADYVQVAELYAGRDDVDLHKLVTDLVMAQDVPYLPVLRYKEPGLRKREQWEKTWALQRREDAGDSGTEGAASGLAAGGKIPVPPKYASTDFQKSHYWTLRGKLDVPKERFISYPGAERDSDPSPVIGWAGWNHAQQAQALAAYYLERQEQDGWTVDRLAPLLAGLQELIPWLKQWHNAIDPDMGVGLGDFYEAFLQDQTRGLGLTEQALRDWRPPPSQRKGARRVARKTLRE